MPREGISKPVDDEWRTRAHERLVELKMTQAQWADKVGMPRSMLSELLSGKRQSTTYLDELHEAIGWPAPLPPLASRDTGEMLYLWDRLDERERIRLLERARMMFEETAKKPK